MLKRTIFYLILVVIQIAILSGCGQDENIPNPSVASLHSPTASTNSTTNIPSPSISTTSVVSTATPDPDSPQGYVLSVPTQAVFIRWTNKNDQLSGQMQLAEIRDSEIRSASHSFTGTRVGSDINLIFNDNSSFGGQSWSGVLKDKALTLVIPASDGKLNTILFRAGTVQDYNDAVTLIENKLNDDLGKAQAAQSEATWIANQKSAVKDLSNDIEGLKESINVLAETNFDSVLKSYKENWEIMQADYTELKTSASVTPFDSSQLGTVQSNLGTMQSDMGSIQSDGGSMQSDTTTMNFRIEEVKQKIKYLQGSWENVSKLKAPTLINQGDITKTIKTGNDYISGAQTLLKEAQQVASIYESKAKNLLDEATQYVSGLQPDNSNYE